MKRAIALVVQKTFENRVLTKIAKCEFNFENVFQHLQPL
ncbi:hypothetical protein CKA32_003560 [Geitlerinema sp. FC II]|nr:hypothetical protein CKA32_003560 [Geitlerinema sp. FC II]